jgi:hypothetical protein
MTEGHRRRHEFAEVLMSELAKHWWAGETRIDRARVEEMGDAVGLDSTEAREAFMGLRGEVWEGEIIESDEEAGWEAVVLSNVPSTGAPKGTEEAR